MMDTLEGNKLIAEFMELKTVDIWHCNRKEFYKAWKDESVGLAGASWVACDSAQYLKYHTSWDWLMPVVEKIRDVSEMGTIGNTISYLMSRIMTSYTNLKGINDLWLAVVDWIEYNNQSK